VEELARKRGRKCLSCWSEWKGWTKMAGVVAVLRGWQVHLVTVHSDGLNTYLRALHGMGGVGLYTASGSSKVHGTSVIM
jgi:hypothetical protein